MIIAQFRLSKSHNLLPHRKIFSSAFGNGGANTHRLTKRVSVPPHLLFNVVSDVARYKEFVPFVTNSFIDHRDEKTGLPIQGGFRVGWKDYDEQFLCKLDCVKDRSIVAESMTTQLFDHLHNKWEFKPVGSRLSRETHTVVDFTLEFKFNNPLYNTVSSIFQDRVSKIMIEAFEKRAKELQSDIKKS